jgi:ComF family protein
MTIANALERWGRAALTLLYPARCCACDAACDEAATFCITCALSLEPIGRACPRCGLPSDGPAVACLQCLERPPPFARARAPFLFGGALARAIRRFKWAERPELGGPLARLLPPEAASGTDLIVPVPLHARRLRSREFNQAALLALAFGRSLGRRGPRVELRALTRVRDTPPQSALGAAERRRNVRDAFTVEPGRIAGRRVLLVDDVLTTGATAEACALALGRAGAAEVAVLTLARAMP